MGAQIIEEGYKTSPSTVFSGVLQANSLERTEAFTKFQNEYYTESDTNSPIASQGVALTFSGLGTDWLARIGFAQGSIINLQWTDGGVAHLETRTVDYINNDVIYIDSQLPAPYNDSVFPNAGNLSNLVVSMNQGPETVEFSFNLAPDGTLTENSIIDGESNIFRLDAVDTLALSTPTAMTQVGTNKSGGQITDVELTLDSVGGVRGITRFYTISYKFIPWVIVEEGLDEPSVFDATGHIVPYLTVDNFAITGNPNGLQAAIGANANANTGGFDQNFNSGTNIYSLASIDWFDTAGNPIDSMDYTADSDFSAVVNAPDQVVGTSEFLFALAWRPNSGQRYKNKVPQIANNLRWNVPDTVFNHSVTPDLTNYVGFSLDGARVDLTNLQFEIVGLTVVVTGRTIPIGIQTVWEDPADPVTVDDRKMTLAVSLSNPGLSVPTSNRVMLKINDEDAIDAPILGVQYPDVVNKVLLNHDGVDIIDPTSPNTTTEDDLLYKSQFLLTKNVEYEGVRARIYAINDITNEQFTIEEQFFNLQDTSFGPFTAAGVYEWNRTIDRNLGLPTTSDRNLMSLTREASLDTGSKYGMELNYGFLSRWESWIANANVDTFFFDPALLNNGLNQNWQRFTAGDWQLYFSYFVRLNGVDDFDDQNIRTRPYDDDPDFTYTIKYFTAGGVELTGIAIDPLNPFMRLEVTVDYVVNFSAEWFELRLEDFEGVKIGFISTVIDSDATTTTVLTPLSGETKLKKTVVTTQTVLECAIDTSLLAGNNVSLAVIADTFVAPAVPKKLTDGTLKRTTGGTFKNLA